MVIREALEYGKKSLSDNLYTDPLNESRKILSFLLNRDLFFVYINLDYKLDKGIETRFVDIIDKRKSGIPLEYIINEKNFYGRDFFVDERALIPRWDTENLITVIKELSKNKDEKKILEIGAGSGAISITLALEIENSQILGVDNSKCALEVCEINKRAHRVENLKFLYSDLFSNVKGKYDIIVSNPPYIKSEDIESLQLEVTHEPKIALDGGVDGLYFYKKIIEESSKYLEGSGVLIFEIGHDQGMEVSEIMRLNNFENICIKKDLQGHDRVIWGVKGGDIDV